MHKLWLLVVMVTNLVIAGYFEDEMDYITKVFPDEISMFCPNLPYYGGLPALAGEGAYMCLFKSDLIESLEVIETRDSGDVEETHKPFHAPIDERVNKPVILLWTHRIRERLGYYKQCPNSKCFLTENRNWLNHSLTKVVYFYGTLFKITDLPLPKPEGQVWALQHEESPKNSPVFSYRSLVQMFNVTSTFRQESHYPITTQYLRDAKQLLNRDYFKFVEEKNKLQKEGLAPIIYVQSDCGTPSDRDRLVEWMMKYINIDSYGKCLNNKQLPPHLRDPVQGMGNKDFIELVSKYKFAIAMENGVCKDYITEKFWRPLAVGTVPITFGAPNVKEFAPNNRSIIDLRDYNSIEELVDYIKYLDENDNAYEKYRQFKQNGIANSKLSDVLNKRRWEPDFDAFGVNLHGTKGNFVNHFDCYLCDIANGMTPDHSLRADKDHYGCPLPMEFVSEHNLSQLKPFSGFWYSAWMASYCDVKVMVELSKGGKEWYGQEKFKAASRRCLYDGHWKRKHLD